MMNPIAVLIRIGCLAALIVLAGPVRAELPPKITRTWTATDGRQLKADLLDFSEQEIKIKRADLQIVKIPLTGLSEDDQKFVKGLVHEVKPLPANLLAPLTNAFSMKPKNIICL